MSPSGPAGRSVRHRAPSGAPPHRAPLVLALVAALLAIGAPALVWSAPAEGPPRLDPPPVELAGSFQGESSQTVYEAIAGQADLAVTFDPGLEHPAVSVDLAGLGAVQALDHVATLAGHFLAPVDARSVLVMADTPQNRRRSEPVGIRTFPLRHAEVKDVLTALRSLIDARRISATQDPPQVTVRDTYAKLAVATRVVELMDRQPWVIHLHLELLPVAPEVATEVAAGGGELSAEQQRAVRGRAGEPLAVGTLGLVGTRSAEWKLSGKDQPAPGETAPSGSDDRLVALEARGRVSDEDRPVGLELELMVLSPGLPRGQGFRQTSSFQVADGATLALPILHRRFGSDEPGASALLLVTPTIVEPGRLEPEAAETIYVGSEASIRLAGGS